MAMFGGLMRPTIRERAKEIMMEHLSQDRTKSVLRAQFLVYTQKVTLIQRVIKLRLVIKSHKKSQFDKNS